MNVAKFSIEFPLNHSEIRKLNKMYFEHLFKQRFVLVSIAVLFFFIFLDLNSSTNLEEDIILDLIRSLATIAFFVIIEDSFVNMVSRLTFQINKRLLRFKVISNRYKFVFNGSKVSVRFPVGKLTHKWTTIEKAILTKQFLFLYIKEEDNYIISISRKDCNCRKMAELLEFVEKNVTHITKV